MKNRVITLLLVLFSGGIQSQEWSLREYWSELYLSHADSGLSLPEFIHNQITGIAAMDGVDGGSGIPYFWNWTDRDVRPEIIYLPTGEKLGDLDPLPGYDRYENQARQDRNPELFWQDFGWAQPVYEWQGEKFRTFGLCSEREMAFVALLGMFGYDPFIVVQGPHCWTQLEIDGARYEIDNTFGYWTQVYEFTPASNNYWERLYNRKAAEADLSKIKVTR